MHVTKINARENVHLTRKATTMSEETRYMKAREKKNKTKKKAFVCMMDKLFGELV